MTAGYAWDYVFDWTIMKYQQNAAAAAARQSTAALDPAGVSRDSRRATAEDSDCASGVCTPAVRDFGSLRIAFVC